ncbi:trypsin-like peptidase domain-containing protein [Actinosynnema sp. NPDC050436]|uniref:trypsin-like peptidase domain-containing protein n=1 Tax=Actinosynnema sp. NPDC050436 TaxID=3155659 RepID=UPI0033D377C6
MWYEYAMPDGSLPTSVVRFTDSSGRTVGAGVVTGPTRLVTCAHVVNLALDREHREAARPTGAVRVEFPALPGVAATASVHLWLPPPAREGGAGEDVCVLRLDVPAGVTPAKLITTPPRPGHPVDVFGFPATRPDGAWVRAAVRGQVAGRLLQLDSESALRVQPGYSGAPVWDAETERVVGIVATSAAQDSYAVPADRLRTAWEHQRDQVTGRVDVLHVAGTRFGDGDRWFGPLHRALGDARPDLVVCTGDLTANGRPSECERGFRFLAHLAEAVELPRDRVVVVPGAADVNLLACRAYFDQEEALEQRPTPPYWPKWGPFAAAFAEFYGDRATFTPDEPWSLFEVPDLAVVVAGLNSTFHDSHAESRADLGQRQVERFGALLRDYQRRGWFRLGAVHRRATGFDPRALNLCLSGDRRGGLGEELPLLPVAPGSFQLVTVDVFGFGRAVHAFRDGWTDLGTDRSLVRWDGARATFGSVASAEPRRTPARGAFFERVHEATVVSHPTATVTPRADQAYLRVSKPREGGGFEQWPVGVATGAALAEDLDRFVELVHSPFASADPAVPSELVYGGPPAASDVVASAQRRGVRLRSFVEYQGLLDLRPLVERQAQRLARDQVYPPELYVPQRFTVVGAHEVQDDVLGQVVEWLGREAARFVMVLGDFGRGKSFLLRQLTRRLPEHLPGLLPVLVELRSLEKAPTLDELLAQHLVREGVDVVDIAKLRYMIRSGRLALLFDGFDELELRVGYDNATDYLGTLLHAVTDRAKVVLTSRTQHFRSANQVLTALGQQVSALTAGRGVVIEDFTDGQIRDFLTRHYQGDVDRAARRFGLIGAISDLLGLSRNPRMLSFIADLDEDRLLEVRGERGRISAAELYRELVDYWLVLEASRQEHRFGTPSFDAAERLAACTSLALRLWETTAATIQTSDLAEAVVATLTRLAERGYSIDQAAQAVGSGTLLVRTEDGFAFVHQSVMEWLVAKVAADDLVAGRSDVPVVARKMSRLMVDFFCDLAGHDVVVPWARAALADPAANDVVKQNAAAVVERLDAEVSWELSGVDLRTTDVGSLDLSGANLTGVDLSGFRLVDQDFSGANLTGADLAGVRMFGGDLTGAVLTGSRWDGAVLLGVTGADHPELARAAVGERDRAEVVVRPVGVDVTAVAFAPGGGLVALAREHVVELVDLRTGRPVRVWRRRDRPVEQVAFSADGALLATVESNRCAYVWDAATGELRYAVPEPVQALAFRSATHVVVLGADGRSRVHTADVGPVHVVPHDPGDVAALSPGGSWLAVVRGTDVSVWSTGPSESGVVVRVTTAVDRLAVSPDGARVAVGRTDGAVEVVEVGTGEVLHLLPVGSRPDALVFSPDGSRLATVDRSLRITVWDVGGGDDDVSFPGTALGRSTLVFSPDGTQLAVSSEDGEAHLHDARTGQSLTRFSSDWQPVTGVAFTAWGLATAHGTSLRHWDLDQWAVDSEHLDDAEVTDVAVTPDGRRLVVARSDGDSTALVPLRRGPELRIPTGVAFRSSSFKADGATLLAVTDAGRLVEWATARHAVQSLPPAVDGERATCVACSPVEDRFAVGYEDGTVRMWHWRRRTELFPHTLDVTSVAFSPDGQLVVTGSMDGTVALLTATGELLRTISIGRTVWAVEFTPDGDRFATATSDGVARTWTRDGRHLVTFTGHTALVGGLSFTGDGTRLATASDDGTARIWNSFTGAELATLVHVDPATDVVVLPDGCYTGRGQTDAVFWAVRQCRFEAGELDPYYPGIRRLDTVAP